MRLIDIVESKTDVTTFFANSKEKIYQAEAQITKKQRELNPFVPDDWYVVECLDIDGVVIWQNHKGEIYQTVPTNKARLISNSIAEYLA